MRRAFLLPLRRVRRRFFLPMEYETVHLAPFFLQISGFQEAFLQG
jgi:hypothetical protein